ncbi:MAG TPA: hypothetical protein VE732_02030 [Nitrososphaera sp.]|jgi:hypothetical protein|nr:hypothetical protein [Nitrososphaera sp.]
MESRITTQSRTHEETVELATRLTREFLNTELFRVLVERKGEAGDGTGSTERGAPPWAHALLDRLWDKLFGG